MIRYDRLWATMEAQGMTQYRLIKHYNFSAGQIGRLKKNMHVSTHTLDTLCTLLGCDISDIIEYIPEGSPAPEEPSVPEAGSAEKETSSKSRKSDSPKAISQRSLNPRNPRNQKRAIKRRPRKEKREKRGRKARRTSKIYSPNTRNRGGCWSVCIHPCARHTLCTGSPKSLPAFSPMIFLLTSSSYPESILSYSLITSAAS